MTAFGSAVSTSTRFWRSCLFHQSTKSCGSLSAGAFQDHERRAFIVELDFIERRQDRHLIGIKRAGSRLEDLLQLVAQGLVDLLVGDVRGDLGDLGGDVGGLAEEDALIDALEEIPCLPLQPAERRLDLRDFEQGIDERLDQLAIGQAAQRRLRGRKRRHQQHLGHRRCGRVALGRVDPFGQGVSAVRHVARNRVRIGRIDLADFLDRRLIVEIEVLKANQESVVVRCEGAADGKPQQPDERSRLLVAAVFGKAGDNVANGRMEGIGLADSLDEGLRRRGDRVDPLRLLERTT